MKRGSALVVAIFIITIVGSVAFGMGRLLFLETGTAVSYENGAIAYYAAESGLEESFLRYRFDQNTEVPQNTTTAALSSDLVARKDLTNPASGSLLSLSWSNISKSVNDFQDTDQVYDLHMNSHVANFDPSGGDLATVSCNKDSINCVLRDEVKKYDVDFHDTDPSNPTKDIDFTFMPKSDNPGTPTVFGENGGYCALIEMKIVGKVAGSSEARERKMLFYNDDEVHCQYGSMITKRDGTNRSYGGGINGSFTIYNIKSIIWPSEDLVEAELRIRPIGNTIAFSVKRSDGANLGSLFGAKSEITSRGYFGGIERKLTANLDRQSGSLYDLFDYVIYKAE